MRIVDAITNGVATPTDQVKTGNLLTEIEGKNGNDNEKEKTPAKK